MTTTVQHMVTSMVENSSSGNVWIIIKQENECHYTTIITYQIVCFHSIIEQVLTFLSCPQEFIFCFLNSFFIQSKRRNVAIYIVSIKLWIYGIANFIQLTKSLTTSSNYLHILSYFIVCLVFILFSSNHTAGIL